MIKNVDPKIWQTPSTNQPELHALEGDVKNSLPGQISPTLSEVQTQVHEWIQDVGVRYFDELTNTAILMEEVGEVARIMSRTYGDQSFKKSDMGKDLGEELSDVMFVLVCLANQTGQNLSELFFLKKCTKDFWLSKSQTPMGIMIRGKKITSKQPETRS